MSSIKEVAKLAGVSAATVSRVLNGIECVKDDTKEQVERAINELNYSPNLQGRHLRKMETKRILVVLNSISNQFYSRVVRGIEDHARTCGYTVILCTTRDSKANFLEHIKMLYTKAVDGAIFLFPEVDSGKLQEISQSYPVVCCCEPISEKTECSFVGIDNEKASIDAIEYLLQKKRYKIAVFGAGDYSYSSVLRERGYKKALKQAGISLDAALVFSEGLTYKAGVRAANKLLKSPELPNAIFAFSDSAAIGAIKQLSDSGIRVPEDISVMGFDNTAISEMYIPSITTVEQPQYEIGFKAMELLINKIRRESTSERIILPHKIIGRESA